MKVIKARLENYNIAVAVITDVVDVLEAEVNTKDILENLPENDAIDNYKSPSKRFRDILWRLLEQDLGRKPEKEEFSRYYSQEYEKLCTHYKDKFDEEIL